MSLPRDLVANLIHNFTPLIIHLAESRDFPDSVQHRRVVLVAMKAADLRQRPKRQLLAQKETDLPRDRQIARAALRNEVNNRNVEMIADRAPDLSKGVLWGRCEAVRND